MATFPLSQSHPPPGWKGWVVAREGSPCTGKQTQRCCLSACPDRASACCVDFSEIYPSLSSWVQWGPAHHFSGCSESCVKIGWGHFNNTDSEVHPQPLSTRLGCAPDTSIPRLSSGDSDEQPKHRTREWEGHPVFSPADRWGLECPP